METVSITRKELYELVWSESMLSLSKKYAISDVGLKKKCKKMNIPVPSLGYWARVQAGQKVPKQLLPNKYQGVDNAILQIRAKKDDGNEGGELTFTLLKQQLENDTKLNLKVPDKLRQPDSLIVAVKEDLYKKDVWKGDSNWVDSTRGHLNIRVTPKTLSRALRIMDTFIKACRALGYDFKVKEKVCLILEEEEFELCCFENYDTDFDKEKWAVKSSKPNGKLTIRVGSTWHGSSWNDGKVLLEERISGILAKLILKAKDMHAQRLAWEKEQKEREDRERIQRENVKRKEKELDEFKALLRKSKRHDRAVMIRSYIAEFERWATEAGQLTEDNRNYMDWARKKADWYDPFIEESDELLEDVDRVKLAFKRRNYWK